MLDEPGTQQQASNLRPAAACLRTMLRAIVLATLPLLRFCSSSSAPAFLAVSPSKAGWPNRARLGRLSDMVHDTSSVMCRHQGPHQPRPQSDQRGCRPSMSGATGMGGAVASSMAAVVSFSSASVSLSIVGTAVCALVGASVVHALQGGVRGDLGLSQEEILGVPSEEATVEHVASLGKAGFMQLFYASKCPAEGDLDGEYRARTLDMGILHPVASLITHRVWGPGRWLGKGIQAGSSEGYNLFSSLRAVPPSMDSSAADGLPADTRRERNFRFSLFSESVFDRGASSKLNYGEGAGNGPLFGGMRDEIRKVNDHLFVGLGYIQAFGGKYNSAPFVLEAPPVGAFSGPDDKRSP